MLESAAWGLRKTARLALERGIGMGGEEEEGSQAQGGPARFSHASPSCRKSSVLPFGSSRPCHVVGTGRGHPLTLPCPAALPVGKAEGLELQLRRRPLRPGSLQLLQDWHHQHPSSSSCLNSSCHLLPLLPDRAGTEDQSRL